MEIKDENKFYHITKCNFLRNFNNEGNNDNDLSSNYSNLNHLNLNKNQENSDRKLIQKISKEKVKKERITSRIESIINKYYSLDNSLSSHTLFHLIRLVIFCRKKNRFETRSERIYNFFRRKFSQKLDIFYYLKQDKRQQIFEEIAFSNQQNMVIDLISKKNYYINCLTFDENYNNKMSKDDENYEKKLLFDYIYSKGGHDIEKIDEKLIKNFTGYDSD